MITENLSTLKIHKLSQEQYNKVVESGNVEGNALYLTPAEDDIEKHNSSTTAHEDIRDEVDKVREAFETIKSNNILDPENYESGNYNSSFDKINSSSHMRTVKSIQLAKNVLTIYITSNLTSDITYLSENNVNIYRLDKDGTFISYVSYKLSKIADGKILEVSIPVNCTQIHITVNGVDKGLTFDNICISEVNNLIYERYIEGEGVGELKEEYLPTSIINEVEDNSDRITALEEASSATEVDYDESRQVLTIKQKTPLENGESAYIDKSLSVDGAAADAKATGDAINELNENLFQLKQQGIIIVQEGNTLTFDNGGVE